GAIAHQIVKWFDEFFVLLRTPDELLERLMATMLDNQEVHERVHNFIQQIDESIDDVFGGESQSSADHLRDLSPEMAKVLNRPVTVRRKRPDGATVDFDLDREESAGTKKILWLAAYLLGILEYGSVAFADELEARLHPHLTRRLVRLFNAPKTNPKNAQLVFVTHDTNLLTYGGLRRDQVWFCEKNRTGSTDLYSLAEIKVRKGARFENDYIGGRYGAIPYFGNVAEVGGETK
ncbi:MAG: AAA family ATPase, partial [Kiritimatiellae bacterium]|nr:AAA family ATPase [Kiritimatiellia bacterium]